MNIYETINPVDLRFKAKQLLEKWYRKHNIPSTKKAEAQMKKEIINYEIIIHKAVGILENKRKPYNEAYVELLRELESLVMFSDVRIEKALESVEVGKVGWTSPLYDVFLDDERREIMNLTRPVEVEEGVHICMKCKCAKTNSISRQIRSSDEPATVFVTCLNSDCGHRWRIG